MVAILHLPSCTYLESRLQKVNDLLNHLTEVVNGKDTIVGRLQSKAAESSLVIEAPYQK